MLPSDVQAISANKHLLVFLAPNIIFIGQMEKDIGRGVKSFLFTIESHSDSCKHLESNKAYSTFVTSLLSPETRHFKISD